MEEMMIEIRHLNYRVGNKQILRDLSFSVKEGSMTCIVGPNGCGKSTLLAHISRKIPTKETIFYKGRAVETIPRREYAREVAVMVQQGMGMVGELKAEDVVLMGRYPFKERFADYSKKDHEIVAEVMEETGASPLIGREMKRMSGGEKQRVLIAKAFTQQPQLLLMDEPTNHLDVKFKLALMENLKKFHQHGTVIVVLHDLSLAARYCDHTIMMKKGEIVETGPTEDILTADKLSAIFEVPFHTAVHDGERYLYC